MRVSVTFGVLFLSGCAESLHAQSQGAASGHSSDSFWPPPRSTSVWIADPKEIASLTDLSLGDVAKHVDGALRRTGHPDERWYTVGAHYGHGFTVSTRLERIDEDGTSKPRDERWSERFAEPSTLIWLAGAHQLLLPSAGRFRVFLVAFTDLPLEPWTNRAPVWNEHTWMGGGGNAPTRDFPSARHPSGTYRLGVYVYEYRSTATDGEGEFVPSDEAELAGDAHVRMSGLAEELR